MYCLFARVNTFSQQADCYRDAMPSKMSLFDCRDFFCDKWRFETQARSRCIHTRTGYKYCRHGKRTVSAMRCKPPRYNRGGVIFQKIYLFVSLADDEIIVPLHPTLYSLLQREDTKVGGSRQGGGATSRCAGSRTAEAAAGRTGDVTSHAGGSSRGAGEGRAP